MKNYPRLAGGTGVSVLHLLPDSLQQPAVVSGRCNGLSAYILHRAEGFCPQAQFMETLLKQRVGMTSNLGFYNGKCRRTH